MRAREIAAPLPVVDRTTTAVDAIRLIADQDLLGVVVAEHDGHPSVLVSSVDVARMMLPAYVRSDLSLANVMGETGVDDLREELGERTVGDLIDDEAVTPREVLVVPPDAHLVELAARMVDARTQVALVDDDALDEPSFVTLPAVLDAVVARWDGVTR